MKNRSNIFKYIIVLFIILLVISVATPFIFYNIKDYDLTNEEASNIIQSVRIHFDNPFQKMFIFSYQIVDKDTDNYLVVGRSFFGFAIVKARISNESIETVK